MSIARAKFELDDIETCLKELKKHTNATRFTVEIDNNRYLTISAIDLGGNVITVKAYAADGESRFSPEMVFTSKIFKKS